MDTLAKWFVGLFLGSRILTGGGGGAQTNTFYVRPPVGNTAHVRLAVIPFNDLSEDTQADQKVMGIFVTQLLTTRTFTIIDPTVVNSALTDIRARGELDASQVKQLSQKLNARLFLLGTISEFGQSRAGGNGLTVAMDARLIDASSSQILWAGVVTRTGKASDSLFGGSGTPSLSRIAQEVVKDLVGRMMKERKQIESYLAETATKPQQGQSSTPTTPSTTPPSAAESFANARFNDESKVFSDVDMKGFLPSVSGFERDDPYFSSYSGVNQVSTTYRGSAVQVDAEITDYGKNSIALDVMKLQQPSATETKFQNLTAYRWQSQFGALNIAVIAGRFVVDLSAPPDEEGAINTVANNILQAMR
ncbi:MAG: hypothetical protein M1330_02750 [Armatimonadetes bacterium]|nr:hypothetical protein [Armatimonadota bacterium]